MTCRRVVVVTAFLCAACGGGGAGSSPTPMAPSSTSSSTPTAGSVNVIANLGAPIAGFQFRVTGVEVTGTSGGAAATYGFTVSTGNNIVIGFSFAGATIPASASTLVVLDVTGSGEACLTDLVISDSSGNALDASITGCLTITMA